MWKVSKKIALLLNERHFEIWFSKKNAITIFWKKIKKFAVHKIPYNMKNALAESA